MLDALLIKEFESDIVESIFVQALYWSLGGSLIEESQTKFDSFIKYVASMPTITDDGVDAGPGELPGQLESIYEYFFDQEKMKVQLICVDTKSVCVKITWLKNVLFFHSITRNLSFHWNIDNSRKENKYFGMR